MKKKILMIDDEVDYTNITKLYLEEAGPYEVIVVNRAGDGFSMAKAVKPDIVLLDISMPGLSGGEVAKQFQEDPELRSIPVIFFTGAYEEIKGETDRFQGRPCLTKPTSGEHLLSFIQSNLRM